MEIAPYHIFGIKRKLYVRYAYYSELMLSLKTKRKYSQFKKELVAFKAYLLKKYQIKNEYEKVKDKIML